MIFDKTSETLFFRSFQLFKNYLPFERGTVVSKTILISFHIRTFSIKYGWNYPRGSREDVKSIQTDVYNRQLFIRNAYLNRRFTLLRMLLSFKFTSRGFILFLNQDYCLSLPFIIFFWLAWDACCDFKCYY